MAGEIMEYKIAGEAGAYLHFCCNMVRYEVEEFVEPVEASGANPVFW